MKTNLFFYVVQKILNCSTIIQYEEFNNYLTIKKIPYFCIIKNKNIENEIVSHKIKEIIDFIDNNIGNIDNFELNNDF